MITQSHNGLCTQLDLSQAEQGDKFWVAEHNPWNDGGAIVQAVIIHTTAKTVTVQYTCEEMEGGGMEKLHKRSESLQHGFTSVDEPELQRLSARFDRHKRITAAMRVVRGLTESRLLDDKLIDDLLAFAERAGKKLV